MRRCVFLGLALGHFWLNGAAFAADPVVFACNEFPPSKMESSDTGLKGFDVEFLEEVFRRADIPLDITYMPWKRALREAERGKVDGMCSCSRTRERDAYLDYSEPLGRVSSGLFALPDATTELPETLRDIGNKSVGVVLGYNLIDKLEAAGVANIVRVSGEIQGAKVLMNGRIDYFYGFRAPVLFYLKQQGHTGGMSYRELEYSDYFSCFSKQAKNADKLLKTFNAGLKAIKADGTYDKILSRYR